MTVLHKTFAPCKETPQFFEQARLIFSKPTRYDTDGLIIAPDGGYNQSTIYKWKPVKDLSIDAELKEGKYYLSEFNKKTNKRDVVKYDDSRTKLRSKIVFRNTLNLSDGIIEFEPLMEEGEIVMDDGKVVLVSKRIRPDKTFPNTAGVAAKLHSLILSPISEQTLKGEDTVLMRKYHNILKRSIFDNAESNSYLIDIGSGKGGDLSKWGNFERVLAVEPDAGYVREFKRRLTNTRMKSRINIIQATSEETEKVLQGLDTWEVGEATVYISFMFSFGFLWDPDRYEGMIRTINAINERLNTKCRILFITIDGERLEMLFDREKSDKITLNTISMERLGTNSITITIDDSKTVARPQTEFFVYPKQLFSRLGYSFIPKYPEEMGMSADEQTYTDMVVFGEAVYDMDPEDDMERLPVSTTEAIVDENNKIRMRGEDAIERVDFGIEMFRVATLDQTASLVHSVLKLSSERYRDAKNPQEQVKIAQDILEMLDYHQSVAKIANKLNLTIKVVQRDIVTDIYNPLKDSTIFIYKHTDDTYEPLVKKMDDGQMCLVFN